MGIWDAAIRAGLWAMGAGLLVYLLVAGGAWVIGADDPLGTAEGPGYVAAGITAIFAYVAYLES